MSKEMNIFSKENIQMIKRYLLGRCSTLLVTRKTSTGTEGVGKRTPGVGGDLEKNLTLV